MTVSYSETISSSQGGVFIKILALWKGSLYKLVYTDLLVYLACYYVFNISYRVVLTAPARQSFELVVKFCSQMDKSIPLSFILGFFVAGVIGRWWQMYLNIPWLNRISFLAYGVFTGTNSTFEVARRIRMCIMRYMNLGWILHMHSISEQITHRFSVQDSVEQEQQNTWTRLRYWLARLRGMNQLTAELRTARQVQEDRSVRELLENINKCPRVRLHYRKLVTESEIEALVRTEGEYKMKYMRRYEPDYWLPLQWATLICKKAMLNGFCDPRSMMMMIEEIECVRDKMQTLVIYNQVMIPLVYTQVVIIAVYSYFLLQLFSQQFVNPQETARMLKNATNETVAPVSFEGSETIDMFFPVFTVFQFLFLMGWLKVAMCVMNPFGDDDEDFHTSEILDINLEISSRCASGQSSWFPEGLAEPSMEWIKKSPGHETDGLLDYLDGVETEFDAATPPDPSSQLGPFEFKETWQRRVADSIGACWRHKDDDEENCEEEEAQGRRRGIGDRNHSAATQPLTADT